MTLNIMKKVDDDYCNTDETLEIAKPPLARSVTMIGIFSIRA